MSQSRSPRTLLTHTGTSAPRKLLASILGGVVALGSACSDLGDDTNDDPYQDLTHTTAGCETEDMAEKAAYQCAREKFACILMQQDGDSFISCQSNCTFDPTGCEPEFVCDGRYDNGVFVKVYECTVGESNSDAGVMGEGGSSISPDTP